MLSKKMIKIDTLELLPLLKKSKWFWCKQLNLKVKKSANEKGLTIDKVLGYRNVRVKTIKLQDKNRNCCISLTLQKLKIIKYFLTQEELLIFQ